MFTKILIANRGEIAIRVATTARKLGIKTVAVYSDVDANAAHVAACDEAAHIGGAAPKESYLRGDAVIAAAKATGAQAIHPGYGFLSENEDFAQACADAGLVFIGPPPSAIQAMGLKSESKRLMEKAGVPLVPGYHGENQAADLLAKEAARIGYPVLIKASAGGGGKGMKPAMSANEFADALASAKREAKNSFGDDNVLIEKYLQQPRHIEIQVFADSHGNCVYLFERDCSVQRRHQKVFEEAPAPGMTAERRKAMGEAAVAAAKAVGYVGAGTVEFISATESEGEQFYFMEMNTRLQVEHPVTEAITGLDLVEWQLRAASGERLPKLQNELAIHGHAIEARVYAEDPDNGFLPAIGTLQKLRIPAAQFFTHGSVRVDAGVREHDAISPFYDPMIAKLIVHAETRAQALAQLRDALAQFHVMGLTTNLRFLSRVAANEVFAKGGVTTRFIEENRAALFPAEKSLPDAALVALALHDLGDVQSADPWAQKSSRWIGQPDVGSMHRYTCGAESDHIEINGTAPQVRFRANDGAWKSATVQRGHTHWRIEIDGAQSHVFVLAHEAQREIQINQECWLATREDVYAPPKTEEASGGHLRAPMPGTVIAVNVVVGQIVEANTALLVMEAMKMEHTIRAPKAGKVAAVYFKVGELVKDGAELVLMEDAK